MLTLVHSDSPLIARRNALVDQYTYLVAPIARQVHSRLPAAIHLDDLAQAGMLGLMAACDKHATARSFEPFAKQFVRAAMIDSVRGKQYRETQHQELPEYQLRDRAPSTLDRMIEDEQAASMIGALTPRQKRAVVLRMDDYRPKEIRAELHISQSGLSKLDQRGRASARTVIEMRPGARALERALKAA